METQEEIAENGGLQATRNKLREHITARAVESGRLLQSYLDLGGSLSDFTDGPYAEAIQGLRGKSTSKHLRVVEDVVDAPTTSAKSKKGSKKKGAKKAPQRAEKAKKVSNADGGDVQAKVLAVLAKADAPMAVSDVATAAGVSGKDASTALKALRDAKKVKQSGKARGTRWAAK
jgi:tetrahydromethanopterin S-methyltransferase subunit H